MGGSQKSKRITWAPDVNLCQVRLFSSAKPPSEVGMGYNCKDHLRAKALPPCSVKAYQPDDTMPPGFEEFHPTNVPRVKSTHIPLTKWRCPPRFEVNSEWQVVSGEESKEVEVQNQRERRVLEAIYPWPSAIPPSPRAPENAEQSVGEDQNIPLIPLTPIEEQADGGLASSNSIGDANIVSTTPVMQPDIAAALASIPCQSNLIDRDLLVRILSDQKVIQQLFSSSHGASSTQCVPEVKLEQKSCSDSNTTRPELNAAPMPTSAAGPSHPQQLRTGFAPPMKDPSYYKTLIQKHGGGNTQVDQPLSFGEHGGGNTQVDQPLSFGKHGGGNTQVDQPLSFGKHGGGNTQVDQPLSFGKHGRGNTQVEQPLSFGKHGGGNTQVDQPLSFGQSNRVMGTTREYQPRPRMMKRCMFFNTLKGCKNGDNCMFQHDAMSSRISCFEVPTAKRVKLGR